MYDLLTDKDFLNKRINEQKDEIEKQDQTTERGLVLYQSALSQLLYYHNCLLKLHEKDKVDIIVESFRRGF